MKKTWLIVATAAALLLAGCGSNTASTRFELDKKHKPLPDYVTKAPAMIQETYIMAAQDPDALAAVPCYCGCYEEDGHTSNLNCFVDKMGPNKEVLEWDPMGIG
ncbi:hypothetical protein EFBL_2009 [Effusibacillus lacus]|uniref:Lipoprotein n=2 Tax=Effusibacillus lacus TaxID=1348429 RepID=A0A292YNP1_9BACL|nr:uncharacterized protein with PCYCGC motif [Effusibacillus lacus]GAX90383.1 hypothetical protein EFBL_2009 [Effusibacillus lacus]